MGRLNRKNRTDIILKNRGGMFDAINDAVKQTWRINDEEYDFICENATDEELDLIVSDSILDFSKKRKVIECVNRLIEKMKSLPL